MSRILPLLMLIAVSVTSAATGQEKEYPIDILYLRGTVSEADGDIITLLDGSKWRKQGYSYVLPSSNILIVVTDEEGSGVAFSDGSEFQVNHISGQPTGLKEGQLTKVVQSLSEGAVLEMADGSMWEIPKYDQFDTGYWLPPYHVIVTPDKSYLINIGKNKRVWARQVE